VRELPDLEVDDHKAAGPAMEEDQIHPVPFIANAQPLLSR